MSEQEATMSTLQRIRRALAGLALAAGALVPVAALDARAEAEAVPATGMICTAGSLAGSTRTFSLVAPAGTIDTPDGNSVFMWSYSPNPGHFQSPGPVLCANQGETVVVNLHNSLPEATSIVFPGQDGTVTPSAGTAGLLTTEVAPGGDIS